MPLNLDNTKQLHTEGNVVIWQYRSTVFDPLHVNIRSDDQEETAFVL